MVSRLWPRSCTWGEPRRHGPLGLALVVLLWATPAPAHELVLRDARRATTGLHLESAGTMSPIRWFPTGASMSPLQGWSGRLTYSTNPVGCARPYQGRGVGFSGYMRG